MSDSKSNPETDTRTGIGKIVEMVVGLLALLGMPLLGLLGIVVIAGLFLLPFTVLYFGIDTVLNFLPIRQIGHWLIDNATMLRTDTGDSTNSLWTPLLLLPGAVLAYRGFIIHRRHVRIVGFIIAFIVGGIIGVIAGIEGIGLLLLATLSGLVGSKIALTLEVAIAMLFGFLLTAILSTFLLRQPINNPIVLLSGVIGGIFGWRAHAMMILFGTAATGAAWMTFVSLGSPLALLESLAFTPVPITLLFLYLFLTSAGIQATFVERLFGPVKYLQGGKNLNETNLNFDESEELDESKDFELEESEAKLFAVITVLVLSVTNSVLFLVIGTVFLVAVVSYTIELLDASR